MDRSLLEVLGQIQILVADEGVESEVQLDAQGSRVILTLPSLAFVRRLNQVPLPGRRTTSLRLINQTLQSSGLTLHISVRQRLIGKLGASARPGPLVGILGYPGLEIAWLTVISLWWSELTGSSKSS